jgi:hypothetical protein
MNTKKYLKNYTYSQNNGQSPEEARVDCRWQQRCRNSDALKKKNFKGVKKIVAEGGRKATYPRESRRFRPGQRGRPPHRWVWPPAPLPPSQLTQEMRQIKCTLVQEFSGIQMKKHRNYY